MKKGPRCPVCGSVNINEVEGKNPADKAGSATKEGDIAAGGNAVSSSEFQWKCGDCYRKFEAPDEKTK
jgi:hypothetical protein